MLKCFVHILFKNLKGTTKGALKYEKYVTMTVWERCQAPSERRL